ncbi:hypothetical protein KAFR_0A02490 [Kazachstania africana CBS 2517]|uniref:Ribosomal RNA-processing protein 1 n=1 Tax=Kazachstania africana (strain ATCC 22294 / BCRC 22015 / CBS 2517 / CECT 1963 / NBRC 1671 / NRRL Y-8276) TaxID=1071382 RepID=H2AMT5_KAZAF|nr:hypothetical protein KAFR_0A02490 [Kazachstania africana CBS 2517]CCF55685.1 hypothetical protein KAFR_0A02490 [Kazachstania africana CBS 2517]
METSTFVKQLSSNNRRVRETSLEALQKFLRAPQLKNSKQLEFDKLWKGLYYAMWFSDRPRPQQRLANKLGELYGVYFDANDNKNTAEEITMNDKAFFKFSKAFWKVLCLEWFNIDRYRLDKYLLLVRRVFFNQLKYLQSRNWSKPVVAGYIEKVLKSLPLSGDSKVYSGIPIHIIDIILDEWERLLTNRNDEFDNEDEEELTEEEKASLVKDTPLALFIEIFTELQNDVNKSKVLRNKIKEDLLHDERLVKWEILSITDEGEEESEAEEDEEEEEEWKGF